MSKLCMRCAVRRRVTLALVLGVLCCAAPSGPALAESKAAVAKRYNAQARKQFNLGNFREAAGLYKSAYEAKPVPEFLHNLAQCYRRLETLEDLERAVFYFESYLNNAPESPGRADVEAELAAVKAKVAELRQAKVRAEVAARKALASAPASAAAPPRPPPLVEDPVPPPRPARTPIYKRWWFWSLIGAAVVGGTVGAIAATTGGSSRMPSGPSGEFESGNFANK